MNLRKMTVLLLAVAMILGMSACTGKDKNNGDDPVAKVGDIVITEDGLHQYMYLYSFLQGIDLSMAGEEDFEKIRSLILEDYIALNIMKLEYIDDPEVLPEDYEKTADEFVANVAGQEQAAKYMKDNSITDEFLKGFYIDQYYSMAFFNDITDGLEQATDEDAKEYYDSNPEQFKIDEVEASHILVKDEKLSKDILQKIKDGEDFAELAKEHSIDGSAAQGGALGTFGRGAMIAEFEEAAFALKPGEISDIVQTQHGYHIIKVTDKIQGTESFEDVKENIKASLNDDAVMKAYTERIGGLREKYEIEYTKDK